VASGTCVGFSNATTQGQCEILGSCNDEEGCIVPLHAGQTTCTNPSARRYASGFCVDSSLNSTFCGQIGGLWHVKATNAADCLATQLCRQRSLLKVVSTPAQCTNTCAGSLLSAFAWTNATWTKATWLPYQWLPYRWFQANTWSNSAFDESKASALQDVGYLAIVGQAVASDLFCRYDRSLSSLRSIACACGSDTGGCDSAFGQISSSVRLFHSDWLFGPTLTVASPPLFIRSWQLRNCALAFPPPCPLVIFLLLLKYGGWSNF